MIRKEGELALGGMSRWWFWNGPCVGGPGSFDCGSGCVFGGEIFVGSPSLRMTAFSLEGFWE